MIASLKGYGRIARAVLAIIAALLIAGIAGSFVMGVRARTEAERTVISQAQAIADGSLTLVFTPADVDSPATPERSFELTAQVEAVVIDPSDIDEVTLYSPEGLVLYSTQQSLIGTQQISEKERVKEALKGQPQPEASTGRYSVMLPLRFRSGVGGPAAVELIRPDTPIATAAAPWRTNALFLTGMLVLLGVAVFGVARVLSVAQQGTTETPALRASAQQQMRPVHVNAPGLREEGDARRKAEDRARAAEDRLNLMQDQYKKAFEELQHLRAVSIAPPASAGDPVLRERALRAEGEIATLVQQVQTLTVERERLADALRGATGRGSEMDERVIARAAEADARARSAEAESSVLRDELARSRDDLVAARRELATPGAETAPDPDLLRAVDTANADVLEARAALATNESRLGEATRELDGARTELRALRNEEQRAAMLDDELRGAKAELESFHASHRADLVEREAEFEEKVRATREEFQRQLTEMEASFKSQVGQKESGLASRIATAETSAAAAARELESARSETEAARAEAASREQRLIEATDELAERRRDIETLKHEIQERTVTIAQARKEAEDLRRSLVGMQADLVGTDERVESMRLDLEQQRVVATEATDALVVSERDQVSQRERVEKMTRMLEEAAGENAELNRRLQEVESRRQLELADDEGRAGIDDLLRVTQERLAGQTEKLMGAEDRVKELEGELTSATEKLDVTEAELRTHQMSEALRGMREPSHDGASPEPVAEVAPSVEDRRATAPFMKELSHDAKKSLSRILGIAQIIKHKKDGKEQAQLLKQLASTAKRLDYTLGDLTEAERLVKGTIELQTRRTDLEALVNRVVEDADLDQEVKIVADAVMLRVDGQRVEQMLATLLRISGDRTPSSKMIVVRLKGGQGNALLSVEDPEPASDVSMSPVVKRVAEIMGGWAKVEDADGKGSAFRVQLVDAEAPASDAPDRDQRAPALQIVVDEPQDEPWEPAAAEQILSRELRRLAELEER